MANKFLSNINLTAGLEADGQPGTSGQVLSSTGTGVSWINPETISSESAEHVQVLVKNTSGATIAKGTPVYVTGETGNSGKIEIAPADASDSAKMPALGLLLTALNDNGEGYCVTGGLLEGLATATIDGTSSTANDTVYVKAGGGLTLTKPSGAANLIQNVAKVARVHASNGSFIVSSILRTNDVPNLNTGKIWVGDGNTTESTVVHLDETNGRMGIGTTSPGAKLDVSAGTNLNLGIKQLTLDNFTNEGIGMTFSRTSSDADLMAIGVVSTDKLGVFSRSGIIFSTGGSSQYGQTVERMRIDSSGNVGIGTTSPGTKLDVSGVMTATGGTSTEWNTAYTHSQADHAPTDAEANVQSDWNATSGDAFILNKPTIPSGNSIIDWTTDQGSTNIHANNIVGYINSTEPNEPFNPFAGQKFHDGVLTNALVGRHDRFVVTIDGTVEAGASWKLSNQNFEEYNQNRLFGTSAGETKVFNINVQSLATGSPASNGITYSAGFFDINFYSSPFPASWSARVKDRDGNWTAVTSLNKVGSSKLRGVIPIGNWLTDIEFTLTARTSAPFVTGNVTYGISEFELFFSRMAASQGGNISSIGGYLGGTITTASGTTSNDWNTAYGWGDHSLEGYLTSLPSHNHDGRYLRTHSRHSDNLDTINTSGVYIWDVSEATDDPTGAADGLLTVKYWDSSNWATASFQDFHNRTLHIKSKKSGTWQTDWAQVWTTDQLTTTNKANYDTAYDWGDHAGLYTPLNDIRSLGSQAFTSGTSPNITTAEVISEIESDGGFDSFSSVFKTSWSYAGNYNLTDAGRFTETAGSSWITWTDNASDSTRGNITALAIAPNTGGSAGKVFIYNDQGGSYSPGWREVWTNTSDGSGSGLDADLLDGQQGTHYLDYNNFTNTPTIPAAVTDYVSKANGGTFSGALKITDALAEGSPILDLHNSTNGFGAGIRFTDVAAGSTQFGNITYRHQDSKSYGSAASFTIGSAEASTTILADGKLMYSEGIYSKPSSGTGAGTRRDSNWNAAYDWGDHAGLYALVSHEHSAADITSGKLDNGRLSWNTSDTFSGTYSLLWNASDSLYTSSWLQVRGSDDTLLTRNIIADGNVGIGTTDPNSRLEIKSNTIASAGGNLSLNRGSDKATHQNYLIFESDSNSDELYIGTPVNSSDAIIGARQGDMIFQTGAYSEKMRITSSGNVGIGTDTPDYQLQVESTGNAEIQTQRVSGAGVLIQSQASAGVLGTNTNHRLDLKTNGGTRATILPNGNVGIGTTSPSEKLDVDGNIKISGTQYVSKSSSASITPAADDWLDIAELPYGEHHGVIALEWNSLFSPSCCHHGWAEFNVGTYYSASFNYGQDTYIELSKAMAHNDFWLHSARVIDYGSKVRVQVKVNRAVTAGSFVSRVISQNQGTITPLLPAINNNSYTILALANIGAINDLPVQKAFGNPVKFTNQTAFDDKVGIGTTDPDSQLNIVSASANSSALIVQDDVRKIKIGRDSIQSTNLSDSPTNLYLNGGGGTVSVPVSYLALGATSASQRLHVNGNARVTGAYYDSNNSPGTSGQLLSSTVTGTDWIDSYANATSIYDLLPAARVNYDWEVQLSNGVWTDIFEGTNVLTEGVWMVKVFISDYAVGGTQYSQTYSGLMSWGSPTSTNEATTSGESEIALHRSGHATNSGIFYLRTKEVTNGNDLKLQGMVNKDYTGNSTINFNFIKVF